MVLSSPTGGATLGTPATLTVTIAPPGAQVPTLLVTNTNDSGPGSLRQAILDANENNSGPNDIQFAIPASTSLLQNVPVPGFDPTSQTWTITLQSALPTITAPVVIDGYSQAHFQVPFRYPNAISSAVQSILVGATGGSFTLTTAAPLPVGTTVPIPFNASAAVLQADLDALLGPGSVSVSSLSGAGGLSGFITFTGAFEDEAIPNLIPNPSALSGLVTGVTVGTSTVGGLPTADPIEISSTPNSVSALDGNNAQQRIIVNGSDTGGGTGFVLASSDSIIRGLIIDGFGVGVSIPGPNDDGDLVQGNFIGQYFLSQFDPNSGAALTGPSAQIFTGTGNALQGVLLGSTNATIGGLDPQDDNVIAGNGLQGVSILPGAVGNQVLGNQIGIAGPSLVGRYAIAPNGADGILIASSGVTGGSTGTNGDSASSNVIGGATTGAGNLISGNLGNGVDIVGPGATLNLVEGNFIGTAPGGGILFGQGFPGNSANGVLIENAPDNIIGGPSTAQQNVISANAGAGVMITGATATGNSVANNIIGLNAAGSSVLGNTGAGVAIYSANNVIGGAAAGTGNVISGNLGGVLISGAAATGNQVVGNLIGTDSTGEADLGNAHDGVQIVNAADNLIEGNSSAPQVISGNNNGVEIDGATSTGNTIQGNFIGTDKAGTLALSNAQSGILIVAAPGNTVGGTSATARNLISANHWGVTIMDATAVSNFVLGNFIGTDVTGKLPLGNEIDGVLITQGASSNSVGGTSTGAGNTIAFNVDNGVDLGMGAGSTLDGGTGNSILSNSIFSNNPLGINIPGDMSTSTGPGPNNLQSFPVLQSVNPGSSSTTIQGSLQSTPKADFLIQFFSNPGSTASTNSEGETLIGSTTVATNAAGSVTFVGQIPSSVPPGSLITATATNLSTGDTSQFSLPASNTLQLVVTNTNDSGAGSLRNAILAADQIPDSGSSSPATSIPDQIVFEIPGPGPFLINLVSPLPQLTDQVDINGYSQYNFMAGTTPVPRDQTTTGGPLIQIDGTGISSTTYPGLHDGLDVAQVNSWIGGLIITGFSGAGISLLPAPNLTVDQGSIGDVVWGNEIGVGTANSVGIAVSSSNNEIGGTTAPNIALSKTPLVLGSVNIVQGNTVAGIALSGTAGTGNVIDGNEVLDNTGDGILVESSNNLIGESVGNLIAGNQQNGIHIAGTAAQGNVIQKNLIGVNTGTGLTTITPTSTQPNHLDGIRIDDATSNVILTNVIGDNGGDGIRIQNVNSMNATANVVEGNLIDFNLDGINISSADNVIGTATSSPNMILSNQRNGITISSMNLSLTNVETTAIANAQPMGNVVQGNLIGTNGTVDDGNTLDGILIADAAGNTIGGAATGAGNIISGNNIGVRILNSKATGNLLEGNSIGSTAINGTTVLPNAFDGVEIANAPGNTVGGTATGAGNELSGNNEGLHITGSGATGNLVEGNFIGTNMLQGTTPVRNAIDGVLIDQGASNNMIGGTAMGAPNTIAFNVANGVDVVGVTTTGNSILSNLIYSNGLLGIDLNGDAATPDLTTAPTGPNDFQAAPVINSVVSSGTSTSIGGTLNSVANTSFLVQFYSDNAATGSGPGYTLLGAVTVSTDANGNASFSATVPVSLSIGSVVSATATNQSTGDTSEFSSNFLYQLTTQFSAAAYTVSETAGTATIVVTLSSGNSTSNVDVNYATTSGGTAVAGVNYTPVSGILVFSPGQTSQSFAIPVIHDFQITGPLTVGIALSGPTEGSLGTPSTAVLTINDVDKAGALEFGGSTMTVNTGATVATVTVLRVGGVGGTVSVAYATGGGTAVPGTDYTSESGVLTFGPGVTSKTVAIPILNSTAGNDKTFAVVLSNPTGGASLGTPATLTITIAPPGNQSQPIVTPTGPTANAVGPVITNLQLLTNGKAITGIVLSFDEALDPGRAENVANYGNVIRTTGPDGVFGTLDDGLVKIASATYNPATNSVTLTPASALPLNRLYQIAINQNANQLTGAGVADPTGALLNAGVTGGPYVAQFALGTILAYVDGTGNNVSLKLTGGGLMELHLGANSEAQDLRILNAARGRSTLTGTVRPVAVGATGQTLLGVLLGTSGVKVHLKNFRIGATSATPLSQPVAPKKSLVHRIKHILHRRPAIVAVLGDHRLGSACHTRARNDRRGRDRRALSAALPKEPVSCPPTCLTRRTGQPDPIGYFRWVIPGLWAFTAGSIPAPSGERDRTCDLPSPTLRPMSSRPWSTSSRPTPSRDPRTRSNAWSGSPCAPPRTAAAGEVPGDRHALAGPPQPSTLEMGARPGWPALQLPPAYSPSTASPPGPSHGA